MPKIPPHQPGPIQTAPADSGPPGSLVRWSAWSVWSPGHQASRDGSIGGSSDSPAAQTHTKTNLPTREYPSTPIDFTLTESIPIESETRLRPVDRPPHRLTRLSRNPGYDLNRQDRARGAGGGYEAQQRSKKGPCVAVKVLCKTARRRWKLRASRALPSARSNSRAVSHPHIHLR